MDFKFIFICYSGVLTAEEQFLGRWFYIAINDKKVNFRGQKDFM